MSFSHLATLGTCSYNGHSFDGSSEISVSVEYVTDEAERTITYNRHTITVRFMVNNPSGVESDMLALRARLSHAGGAFILTGHGFGNDLRVNIGGGGMRDVKFGPMPKMLSWNPVGGNNTAEVEWQVVVCVPTCSTSAASPRTTGIMALNYGVTIDIDLRGISTRTITGYLEIAQTRNGRNIPDSADNYRQFVNPPPIPSFERTSSFDFSLDKSRVNFTITDRQIASKNAYPNGVIRIDGTHRGAWHRGGRQNHHGINLTIETAIGTPATLAWDIFLAIAAQRLLANRSSSKNAGNRVWIDALEVEEDIFGTASSFSLAYRVLKTNQSLLAGDTSYLDFPRQGLWQPIKGTDWRLWKTSLQNVQNDRGLARLAVPAQGDAIVDLCGSNTIPWQGVPIGPGPTSRNTRPVLRNEQPPPDQSFLEHKMRLQISRNTAVSRQSPLQAPSADSTPPNQQRPQGMSFPPPANNSSSSTPTESTIQQSGLPQYSARLTGGAMRAGYEVPQPRLVQVGSQTPVESAATFIMEQVGVVMGVPVYRALWDIWYEMAFPPGNISPPANLEN